MRERTVKPSLIHKPGGHHLVNDWIVGLERDCRLKVGLDVMQLVRVPRGARQFQMMHPIVWLKPNSLAKMLHRRHIVALEKMSVADRGFILRARMVVRQGWWSARQGHLPPRRRDMFNQSNPGLGFHGKMGGGRS